MTQPLSSAMFKRELCDVPITALAFFSAGPETLYILAGEDGNLRVYTADSGRLVCDIAVFADQPIHGIEVQQESEHCQGNVLVWGGSSVALFTVDAESLETEGYSSGLVWITAPDWIYHGATSPFDASRAALVTAHNEIITTIHDNSTGKAVFSEVASASRLMLYSAHLTWISDNTVLVAGGTVFGDVLVWKCRLGKNGYPASFEMLFSLTGHEGSIFGVDISPPVVLSNGSTVRLVASCSDDRTIRIWDISEHTQDRSLRTITSVKSEPGATPETGFRIAPASEGLPPSRGVLTPIAIAMGHLSRIWSAIFAPLPEDSTPSNIFSVYSFGEDSTTQRWQLEIDAVGPSVGSANLKATLKHVQTFSLHNGKHLWANASLFLTDRTVIATGGADSRICLIEEPLSAEVTNSTSERGSLSSANLSLPNNFFTLDPAEMPSVLDFQWERGKGSESFARYDFVRQDQLLLTTSFGRLLLYQMRGRQGWKQVTTEPGVTEDIKRCYVLRMIGDGVALLGTTSGTLYCFRESSGLEKIASLPGRIYEITCLSNQALHSPEPSIEVIIRLHAVAESHLLVIDRSSGTIQSHEEVAGLDPRFVIVSAARVGHLIVMGSRSGWMSLLKKEDAGYRRILEVPPRGEDAVTAIVPLPIKPTCTEAKPLFILTTSRDGKYRIHQIDEIGDRVNVQLVHETSPPLGPMIEGAWFTSGPDPQLILYGFRSKYFIIWNESSREELASVECGGANRTVRLLHNTMELGRFHLAFTRASKLTVFSQERVMHRRIKAGGHGREVRTLSSNGVYLATASEDTSIRLWKYSLGQSKNLAGLQYVSSMKAHKSGLQRLKWLDQEYLFSSAGNEEFFVWRVRPLDSEYARPGILCEGVFTDKSPDEDLRIMDFDVARTKDEESVMVTMAFSNSSLKTYRYTSTGSFQLVAEGSHTGACLTQVRHLDIKDDGFTVLTASTDGYLCLWKTDLTAGVMRYSLVNAMSLHQNSVKGLDILKDEGRYIVLTGGDDNAIGATTLNPLPQESGTAGYAFSDRTIVRSAHAAAINDMALVRLAKGSLVGVSVSNDQIVRIWRIEMSMSGTSRITRAGSSYSAVADAGVLAVTGEGKSRKVLVAGVGIEIWNLLLDD